MFAEWSMTLRAYGGQAPRLFTEFELGKTTEFDLQLLNFSLITQPGSSHRPCPALTHGVTPLTYSPAPHVQPRPSPRAESGFRSVQRLRRSMLSRSSFLSLHDVESAALPSQDGGMWGGGAAIPPAGAGGRCERMREWSGCECGG